MPKRTVTTPIQKVLVRIRPVWIDRVGQELARGMEVHAGFEEQLERFFDLLSQSITTGASRDQNMKRRTGISEFIVTLRLDPDGTAMCLQNATCDWQSQPGTAALKFCLPA